MKTIGIATFHFADNYGAVLQAYALYSAINRLEGYKAEIINFIPYDYALSLYENSDEGVNKLKNKRKLFRDFVLKKMNVDIYLPVSEIPKNYYDIYCAGSDQIWNMNWSYVDYLFPDITNKKISYASSIGMKLEELSNFEKIFSKYLTEFSALSLREDTHIKYIEKISNKKCEHVLDPSFLLDSSDYITIMHEPKHLPKDKYIFLFWIGDHDKDRINCIRFANKIARKTDSCIIHSIINNQGVSIYRDDGCMIYEGIEQFLWYIKHAEHVITNSYHAVVFSIIFKKQFHVFNRSGMESRIDSLLNLICLKKQIVCNSDIDYLNSIDYNFVYDKLKIQKEKSLNYLIQALEEEDYSE